MFKATLNKCGQNTPWMHDNAISRNWVKKVTRLAASWACFFWLFGPIVARMCASEPSTVGG
jgi:hypothetical protein